jgi:hypothetical protein
MSVPHEQKYSDLGVDAIVILLWDLIDGPFGGKVILEHLYALGRASVLFWPDRHIRWNAKSVLRP